MASIYDIAKKTGVSPSTVSLILNNKADNYRISKKTQKKVLDVAQATEYIPNVAARQLLAGSSNRKLEVALFWEQDALWYIAKMLTKVKELVSENVIHDMNIKIYPYSPGELNYWEHILSNNLNNGFIISTSNPDDIEFLRNLQIKTFTIIIHSKIEEYYSVIVDACWNAKNIVRIFNNNKIKNIGAIIERHETWHTDSDRIFKESFKEACEDMDINVMFMHQYTPLKEFSADFIESLVDIILNNKNLPEGIYISGASLAVNIAYALKRRGVSIPEDLQMITYGIDENTALCDPPITLLQYPINEISNVAYQKLDMLFKGEHPSEMIHVCKSSVLFRQSCPQPESW